MKIKFSDLAILAALLLCFLGGVLFQKIQELDWNSSNKITGPCDTCSAPSYPVPLTNPTVEEFASGISEWKETLGLIVAKNGDVSASNGRGRLIIDFAKKIWRRNDFEAQRFMFKRKGRRFWIHLIEPPVQDPNRNIPPQDIILEFSGNAIAIGHPWGNSDIKSESMQLSDCLEDSGDQIYLFKRQGQGEGMRDKE